jgi:hypothetical protein
MVFSTFRDKRATSLTFGRTGFEWKLCDGTVRASASTTAPCLACSASASSARAHAAVRGHHVSRGALQVGAEQGARRAMLPFRYTVNGYRGCSHACRYCFARPTHEYLDMDCGADFDTQVVVKTNRRPRCCGESSHASRGRRETVALGTNTDPYQRAEGRYALMPESSARWRIPAHRSPSSPRAPAAPRPSAHRPTRQAGRLSASRCRWRSAIPNCTRTYQGTDLAGSKARLISAIRDALPLAVPSWLPRCCRADRLRVESTSRRYWSRSPRPARRVGRFRPHLRARPADGTWAGWRNRIPSWWGSTASMYSASVFCRRTTRTCVHDPGQAAGGPSTAAPDADPSARQGPGCPPAEDLQPRSSERTERYSSWSLTPRISPAGMPFRRESSAFCA